VGGWVGASVTCGDLCPSLPEAVGLERARSRSLLEGHTV
jgi:hypothetical protein